MFDSAFAAFYFPWLVVEKNEERIPIPPSGHIAGIIARCDEQMGLNRPPANEVIEGHLDLALILREEDIGFLNREGINCLKSFPTKGIRIWGARTTSSDPQLKYLNVRRILNGIIKAVSLNLQWAVFEPNTPRIWKTISREVSFFMLKLWEKGFFKGSSPEEAFYVKCDHETNPAEMINSGFLTVEVGVAPVRPTEYIAFRLTQEMQTTSENQ
jgi:phage tail sheath protein FI